MRNHDQATEGGPWSRLLTACWFQNSRPDTSCALHQDQTEAEATAFFPGDLEIKFSLGILCSKITDKSNLVYLWGNPRFTNEAATLQYRKLSFLSFPLQYSFKTRLPFRIHQVNK